MYKIWIYIDGRNFELGVMNLLGIKDKDNLKELYNIIDINKFIENITNNKNIIILNKYMNI